MSILFLCDVDGTLSDGNGVAARVVDALRDFVEAGNYFGLATGRHAFGIHDLLDSLPVNAASIILAGAALYDVTEARIVGEKPLHQGIHDKLARLCQSFEDVGIQVFTTDGLYNLRLNEFLRTHGIESEVGLGVSSLDSLTGQTVLKVGLCCEDSRHLARAAHLLCDNAPHTWHLSHEIGAEVVAAGVSKGTSIDGVLARLPKDVSCLAVAGDSPNDLSMFDRSDISFAPVTGFFEVKEQVDHIIGSPSEGGVADALSMLMEIQERAIHSSKE